METAYACAEKLGRDRAPAAGDQLPFDLDRAFGLYQALLEPVAKDIEGKELILVPSGPLATLPFQVLLTEKPAPAAGRQDLAKAPWLVKRFTTTVLPSVSSLKALRQVCSKEQGTETVHRLWKPAAERKCPERFRCRPRRAGPPSSELRSKSGAANESISAKRATFGRCPLRRHGRS